MMGANINKMLLQAAFHHKTHMLRLTIASLLLIAITLSGCSRMRGARLFLYNGGDSPVRVEVQRENWSNTGSLEKVGVSVLVFPHSGKWFDQRLRHKESYVLNARTLQGRKVIVAVSQDLIEQADGGEIRVTLNNKTPHLIAGPDRDLVEARQSAFRGTLAFLAVLVSLTSVIYWAIYWYRRQARL